MLRNNPFQVQFADPLKQRPTMLLDVFDVLHSGFRHLRQQTTEFVLAVCQSFRPQVLAVSHQQIECEEARLAPMKEQVIEFRPSLGYSFSRSAFKDWACYFTTWRLLVTEKAPDTPFARILAMFLSASLSTTPSRVTFPFFTMMRIGFCTPKAYFCKAG